MKEPRQNAIMARQGWREERRTAVLQWERETGSRSAFAFGATACSKLQPAPIVLARTMEIFLTRGALLSVLVAPMVGWLNFARTSPPSPPPLPHHVQCTSHTPSPSVISRTNGYRRSGRIRAGNRRRDRVPWEGEQNVREGEWERHCAEEKKENRRRLCRCRAERSEIGENCATVESGYARSRIRLGIGQSMTYLRCLQTGLPRHPPRLPHSIGATCGDKYLPDGGDPTFNKWGGNAARSWGRERFHKLKTSRENDENKSDQAL